jgi:manganese transport protein
VSPHDLAGTLFPEQAATPRRRLLAYFGPALLVGVGYIDPGNWASDLEAGARFGYTLVWVLVAANLIALVMQTLAARLGVVARLDLAQACRRHYPRPVAMVLFVLCEIAIVACDLAEVIGSAVALNLLFGIPLLYGALITVLDVLLLLALQRFGMRRLEALILVLVLTVGGCLALEWSMVAPSWGELGSGLVPRLDGASLYLAVAMLGATVMPHNLYLHSWLVQSRAPPVGAAALSRALRFNLADTLVALNVALFINVAILVVAAGVFHPAGVAVTDLREAHSLLTPLLGTTAAGLLFAIALLCAGQSSTITGTLAGQVVVQGFLEVRGSAARVRLITRCVAITPAVIAIAMFGEDSTVALLVGTQVVLSLQLPFAIVPLVRFTAHRRIMGRHASPWWLLVLASLAAVLVIACNAWLVGQVVGEKLAGVAFVLAGLFAAGAGALVVYLACVRLRMPLDRLADAAGGRGVRWL